MASAPKKSRGKSDCSLWTKEKTLQLITLFESTSDLWNVKSPLYYNRNHKQKLLAEIGGKINIDATEVAAKLHNLRCQYNGEMRKLKAKRSSGTNEPYVPRWEFFNTLKFLSNVGQSCSTTSNLIQPDKTPITPKSTPAAAPVKQQQYEKPPSDSELFDRELQKLTNLLTQSERKYEWLGEQVVTTLNDLTDKEIIDETIFAVQKLLHVAKSRHRNANTDIQHSAAFPTCPPVEILESIVVKEEPELQSSQNTTVEDSQFVAVRSSLASDFLNEFMEES